jgi:branched-chain amino acid transport system substrate-binding protein
LPWSNTNFQALQNNNTQEIKMHLYAPFLSVLFVATSLAHAADDIVITQIASPTHPVTKANAEGLSTGFNIFFARINAAGGINGRKVILSVKDDNYSPADTVRLVKDAIADSKSMAIFGTVGTGNLAELIKSKALTDNGMSLVSPAAGIPALLTAANVFPIRASYFDQLRQVAKHSRLLHRKKVAFLHIENALAPEMKQVLEAGLAEDGRKLTGSTAIVSVPDPVQTKAKVEEAVDQMLANNPDTCVLFGPGAVGPLVVTAIREKRGQAIMIYGIAVAGTSEIIKVAGLNNANGVIIAQSVPLPNDSRLEVVKQYMVDIKKYAPQEKLSPLMLEGYLGARILYEGLKRAGPNPTRASLTTALNGLGRIDVGGFEVDYTPGSKSGNKAVDMTMINKNGVLIR